MRDYVHRKRDQLVAYVRQDSNISAQIVRLTILYKALTHNKQMLHDNFDPYILDSLQETVEITK
jgi:hypothetical protein